MLLIEAVNARIDELCKEYGIPDQNNTNQP